MRRAFARRRRRLNGGQLGTLLVDASCKAIRERVHQRREAVHGRRLSEIPRPAGRHGGRHVRDSGVAWSGTAQGQVGEYLSELRAMSHTQRVQRRPVGAAAASPSADTVQETRQTRQAGALECEGAMAETLQRFAGFLACMPVFAVFAPALLSHPRFPLAASAHLTASH
jgi:hypothetical protein